MSKASRSEEAGSDRPKPKKLYVHKQHVKNSQSSTEQALKRERKRKHRKRLQAFFDEEAELGSDDEENDDAKRVINRNEAEENEDGLDEDLDGFVVKGDDEVIDDADEEMHQKFLMDLENDDKIKMR